MLMRIAALAVVATIYIVPALVLAGPQAGVP